MTELQERNRRASDPEASVWVTANAGSGKTYLLVDRVIRLLLSGTKPARILCLTFTKAAASEMSRRLFDRLSGWIAMGDTELKQAVYEMTGESRFDNAAARRLFAQALETPGGLKIQTIHAFCERLLQRFPLEAGVVPGFSVLDDQGSNELLAEARSAVLDEAASGADQALAESLEIVVSRAGADAFDELLNELLAKKKEIARMMPGDALFQRLSDALELGLDEDEASIRRNWHEARDATRWRDLAVAMLASGVNDQKQGAHAELIARTSNADASFKAACSFFLTSDGDPRKTLATKKIADSPLGEFAEEERHRFDEVEPRAHAASTRASTFALLHLAKSILDRFAEEKRRLGLYGYDDLIERARHLLSTANGEWVLYKLDGGLDHVLIDEAQDTSPDQWSVIGNLTKEFFSGQGARPDVTRTIFVVGDEKQSIYSFQGADPERFAEMKAHFAHSVMEAQKQFRPVELALSFRSTAPVLQSVDFVWNRAGGPSPVAHQAHREGQQGLVELWQPLFKQGKEHRAAWQAPTQIKLADHPRLLLARRIAQTVKHWIDSGEMLSSRGRPITPGDILILLRKRGEGRASFMDAIVDALKQAGLPVAGADRLKLTSHIGVLDLIALARFVLNPADDLSLAALIKSPLLEKRFTDEDLLAIAPDRGSASLWHQVKKHHVVAATQLAAWGSIASLSPFEFFTKVLIGDNAYGRLLHHLGGEAAEPLDAFLAKCLDYETDHAPSLGGFIAWLEQGASEIKRDMDHGGGEIRVMTVHGAKGLEANIVMLPDTCEKPDGNKKPRIYFHEDAQGKLPIWRTSSAKRGKLVTQLYEREEQAMEEEYSRLLYVAMTRASDRLYIAGAAATKNLKDGSWYSHIETSLKPHMQEATDWQGQTVWRLENTQDKPAKDKQEETEIITGRLAPPAWAALQPPAEKSAIWLPPSRISLDPAEIGNSPASPGAVDRFKRGTIIHTLLQYLPELAPQIRADACRRYLARKGLQLAEAEAQDIAREVLGLLESPGFEAVFAPGSMAEVPLAALIGEGQALSGRIDRLAVTQTEVLIADYKTNRPPPVRLEDVSEQYRAQLAAYRAALTPLFPGKTIRTALIWTDGPRFMEVP
jgi:ATP-dependent helicase/nuclease subunit A